MNTKLMEPQDITIRERALLQDVRSMNAALEKFAELFEDTSKIDRDSLIQLGDELRGAGRADLADRVSGWLK